MTNAAAQSYFAAAIAALANPSATTDRVLDNARDALARTRQGLGDASSKMPEAPTPTDITAAGIFSRSGPGASLAIAKRGELTVSLAGGFFATVALERSFDDGVTWLPLFYSNGLAVAWTGPVVTTRPEAEVGTLVRLNCAWTSGVVAWQISQ